MSADGLLLRPVTVYAFLRDGRVGRPPRPGSAGTTSRRQGPRRRAPLRLVEAVVAAGALLVGSAGGAVAAWDHLHPSRVVTVIRSAPPATLPSAPRAGAEVAAAVLPSVVSIAARGTTKLHSGTGIVIGSDGTVLTNNHVIANVATNGGSITLTLSTGGTAVAYVVGRDETQDVAVLRAVGMSGLTPATLASTATLRVGDTLYAIGQFMEFPDTVTGGIVAGLHRTITAGTGETPTDEDELFGIRRSMPESITLTDLIQTDVIIAPGNSGGPLVDDQGRVVGVNTACEAGEDGGPGFAIPIERAYRVAQRILAATSATPGPAGP